MALVKCCFAVIMSVLYLDFEALKQGKISVVEPIYALEIPITAMLAAAFLGEILTGTEVILIIVLMLGIMLLSLESVRSLKKIHIEKGVRLAVAATITMGVVNYLFGVGAREIGFLMINWFTNLVLVVVCFIYLLYTRQIKKAEQLFLKHKGLAIWTSIFDNAAWIAFAASIALIPIAIATSISEAYIALAALLGVVFNREKLDKHQWLGLVVVIVSVIWLAKLVG